MRFEFLNEDAVITEIKENMLSSALVGMKEAC
jgi:hypothetical protein